MSPRTVYIPTNAPAAVALSYGCHLGNVPRWLRIIDNPEEFETIPPGALVGAAVWIGHRDVIEAWRNVWAQREQRRDFDWLSPEQEAAMAAWFARHRAEPECLRGRKAPPADAAAEAAAELARDGAELAAASDEAATAAPTRREDQPRQSRWR